jgi:REP element-mobilizing transposase RayT
MSDVVGIAHGRSSVGFRVVVAYESPRTNVRGRYGEKMDDNRRWYHCICHTYASWLYGDSRGFRSRHHREHVEGDYKNPPPPGRYAKQLERSIKLLKQPPVTIQHVLREVVGMAMVEKLLEYEAQLLALSVSSNHVHLLAKMPPGPIPRLWVGYAKRNATFQLKEIDWHGKLWAKRSDINPIQDRPHQLNTYQYILRHSNEGAWVWDFRDRTNSTT